MAVARPGLGRNVAGMSDNIIRFPGAAPAARPEAEVRGPDGLSEEQRKAAQIVLSGLPFVVIGLKTTEQGADFFTAVHGDPGDLRNALPHLAGVIERAFARKNIVQ